MIRRVLAPALALVATAAAAMPLLSPHHYPVGANPPLPDRIILSGDLSDPADPGDVDALDLEMIGDVLITGALDHAGYTLCWGVCTITPPARSPELRVRCDSRVRVEGDWVLPAGMLLDIRACATVVVAGTLTAPAGGQAIDVSGTPPILPAVILSADALAGTWSAGTLPAGTALTITATQAILEAAP